MYRRPLTCSTESAANAHGHSCKCSSPNSWRGVSRWKHLAAPHPLQRTQSRVLRRIWLNNWAACKRDGRPQHGRQRRLEGRSPQVSQKKTDGFPADYRFAPRSSCTTTSPPNQQWGDLNAGDRISSNRLVAFTHAATASRAGDHPVRALVRPHHETRPHAKRRRIRPIRTAVVMQRCEANTTTLHIQTGRFVP